MATASSDLSFNALAAVDSTRPNVHLDRDADATTATMALLIKPYAYSNRSYRFVAYEINLQVRNSNSSAKTVNAYALTSDWDQASVTWTSKPQTGEGVKGTAPVGYNSVKLNITDIELVRKIEGYGLQVNGIDNAVIESPYVQTFGKLYYDTTPVKLVVTADTVPVYRYAPTTFTWSIRPEYEDTLSPVEVAYGKFRYKTSSSGAVTEHNIRSTDRSITLPANTFSTSSIMIQLEITADNGQVTTSAWKTLSVQGASIVNESPQTGYINETVSNRFSWELKQNGAEAFIPQSSATFQYKYSSSGAVTEVTATTNKYVTIPANTFTGDTVMWRVVATPTGGTAITSPWYTLTTVEVTSTAAAISPVNEAVDGSAPITFRWAHIIATGTPQKKYDLQYSTNGTSWSTLSSVTTANTYYTAAAGRFTSGTYYWRVRTYNSDNIAGAWSDPVQIIVIAAPGTPALNVTSATPKWSIQWSQDGQQGYEIEFDGKVIYSGFGTATTYTFDGLADDGEHTVRVRVQNLYSLWSPWASATFSIVNDPPRTLTLTAALSPDAPEAVLTIGNTTSTITHWIYRNGELIARTNATSFTDRYVNGDAVYTVRGLATSGVNYSVSNEATVSVAPVIPWIYSLRSGWIPLRMSAAETNAAAQTYASAAAFLHFAGAPRPFVEFGEAVDRTLSFAVGFLNGSAEQAAFTGAVGGIACLKLPDGDVIIGALTGWSRTHGRIYTEYSATITEAEFDEVAANG